jgi:aspartyl-tRNA synthetase
MFATAEGLRNEFCIQIKGLVRARYDVGPRLEVVGSFRSLEV